MTSDELDTLFRIFGASHVIVLDEPEAIMNGTIVRVLPDKGFGFLKGTDGVEYFFHRSGFNGFFDDLIADMGYNKNVQVTFEVEKSPKGPRAKNVTRTDAGTGI